MRIKQQSVDRIVFHRRPLRDRLVALVMATGFLLFGSGVLFSAITHRVSKIAAGGSALSIAVLVAQLIWGGGLLAFGIAIGSKVMPFHIEITRAPLMSQLVWGPLRVRTQHWSKPTCVVAEPLPTSDGVWYFALFIRTEDSQRSLLSSHEHWPSRQDADLNATKLGEEIARFLGCPFELEAWAGD